MDVLFSRVSEKSLKSSGDDRKENKYISVGVTVWKLLCLLFLN